MFLAEREADGCRWRKAKHSANDGVCIEVAVVNYQIAARDSESPCAAS